MESSLLLLIELTSMFLLVLKHLEDLQTKTSPSIQHSDQASPSKQITPSLSPEKQPATVLYSIETNTTLKS